MATEELIREKLDKVLVPGAMRNLVKMNLVRDIKINNGKINIELSSTALVSTESCCAQ